MLYFVSVIMILVVTLAFVFFASGEETAGNIEFLESYGWSVDAKCVDEAEVIVPNPFDRVYESYNKLQLRAGLDLRPYRGMHGRRYTYIVKNYPRDVGEEVRANVLCIDGECVAGDIMTVSVKGFMHSLKFEDALQ